MSKQLYQALLEAKGVAIKGGRRPGKAAQFETTVHKTGVILIGKTYSQEFGVEPGDVLDIVISEDSIQLVPQGSKPARTVTGSVRVG
jgi:bifunctional DNA-binding transcriptional regulator/antitoxin component of YhaV-PrlF toxin-antitoxin module